MSIYDDDADRLGDPCDYCGMPNYRCECAADHAEDESRTEVAADRVRRHAMNPLHYGRAVRTARRKK